MDDGLNHPVNRLAMCRQRIKALQAEEATLKAACLDLAPDDRVGRYNEARVTMVSRSTIDTKALSEALGIEVLVPFTRVTEAVMLTVKAMGGE